MVKPNKIQQTVIDKMPYEYRVISQYDDGAVLLAPTGRLQYGRVVDGSGQVFSLTRYLTIRNARRRQTAELQPTTGATRGQLTGLVPRTDPQRS
jgi:hypothetical protein